MSYWLTPNGKWALSPTTGKMLVCATCPCGGDACACSDGTVVAYFMLEMPAGLSRSCLWSAANADQTFSEYPTTQRYLCFRPELTPCSWTFNPDDDESTERQVAATDSWGQGLTGIAFFESGVCPTGSIFTEDTGSFSAAVTKSESGVWTLTVTLASQPSGRSDVFYTATLPSDFCDGTEKTITTTESADAMAYGSVKLTAFSADRTTYDATLAGFANGEVCTGCIGPAGSVVYRVATVDSAAINGTRTATLDSVTQWYEVTESGTYGSVTEYADGASCTGSSGSTSTVNLDRLSVRFQINLCSGVGDSGVGGVIQTECRIFNAASGVGFFVHRNTDAVGYAIGESVPSTADCTTWAGVNGTFFPATAGTLQVDIA